ncbi:uncharacterized protein LOC115883326 [Sitophilus oryzae]|uniref:Uncharacterized protein LOC115883326 n=1 Tax=Sitophilus oryzae TaxID=7048 RepID=A0A6J2Y3F6_SITOR|nr:uncharacterized protein LOC115883326 [Sitophilus oryzae]
MVFANTFTKNRHVSKFHPEEETTTTRKKHIKCPICPNEENFSFHDCLIKHLSTIHNLNIQQSVFYFRNLEEFTAWMSLDNKEGNYARHDRQKHASGEETILYNCNRSNSKGFVSSCSKRNMKTGGSIRINGTCPSRILVKITTDGQIQAKFFETCGPYR